MVLKRGSIFKSIVTFVLASFLGFYSYGESENSRQEKYEQSYKMKENVKVGDWFQGPHIQKVFVQTVINKNLYTLINMNSRLRKAVQDQSTNLTSELDKKTSKNLNDPGVIFNSVQTYTLVYMLALIHIVVEDNEIRNIDPEMLGKAGTIENLLTAGYDLLVSGEMISSIFAAGATHKLFKIPLEKFNEIVTSKALAPLVKNLIISFSNSLVSFTGWEFGAQLWKEAINMLDYQLAGEVEKGYLENNKNRLIVNAFKVISHGKGRADTNEVIAARKILSQTFQNILYMLTLGSDGQIQWLYNTLRHRLLNGHFVSLILTMGSASALGSTYLPLLAPLLSTFGIGIAGGLASIYLIPEEQKHIITTFLRDQKMEVLKTWEKNAATLYLKSGFDEITNQKNKKSYVSKIKSEITFEEIISKRESFRQKIIENYIDQTHYYYNQIINDNDLLVSLYVFVQKGKANDKANKKIQELINNNIKNTEKLFENLEKIVLFYLAEAQNFNTLKDMPLNQSVSGYLDLEQIDFESLASHFCSVSHALLLVDFIKNKSDVPSNPNRIGSVDRLASMCNFKIPTPQFNYTDLGDLKKKLYDSSVFFIQQTNKGRFNEVKLILDRTRILTEMFSSP